MVIELRVVQFWSEIIFVISNRTRATRSFDFETTRMISDQIALHSVQLPLFILICIELFIKLTSQNNVLVNAWIEFDGLINAYKLSTAVLLFRNSLEVRSIFAHV